MESQESSRRDTMEPYSMSYSMHDYACITADESPDYHSLPVVAPPSENLPGRKSEPGDLMSFQRLPKSLCSKVSTVKRSESLKETASQLKMTLSADPKKPKRPPKARGFHLTEETKFNSLPRPKKNSSSGAGHPLRRSNSNSSLRNFDSKSKREESPSIAPQKSRQLPKLPPTDKKSTNESPEAATSIYATLPRRSKSTKKPEAPTPNTGPSHRTPVRTGMTSRASSSSDSGKSTPVSRPSTARKQLTPVERKQSPLTSRAKTTSSTPTRPSPLTKTPQQRRERLVIYHESSTQTVLHGSDIQSALQSARSTPVSCICEQPSLSSEVRSRPDIITTIRDDASTLVVDSISSVDQEVQVEINFYDPSKSYTLADTQNLVNQLKKLTEEHSKLEAEYARLRNGITEVETLKEELKKLRKTLEEERAIKNEVQQELDDTSQRVQNMLNSLEGVEKEFTNQGLSLAELEKKLEQGHRTILRQQEEIDSLHQLVITLKKDLEKSLAAQKTLLQQLQETESESRELQEFLQVEKNTLQEALKDSEGELRRLRSEAQERERLLHEQTVRYSRLLQLAEDKRSEGSESDMLLHQGAEMSSCAVVLTDLLSRIHSVTLTLAKSFHVSPPSPLKLSNGVIKNGESGLPNGDSAKGSEVLAELLESGSPLEEREVNGMGLVEQVMEADRGLTHLLRVFHAALHGLEGRLQEIQGQKHSLLGDEVEARKRGTEEISNQSSVPQLLSRIAELQERIRILEAKRSNSNCQEDDDHAAISPLKSEVSRLRLQVLERDGQMSELRDRYAKHRAVLTENWRRAENEVARLDHTMDRVLLGLQSSPEAVASSPGLKNLLEELAGTRGGIGNSYNGNKMAGWSPKRWTNGTIDEAAEIETIIE